MTTQEADKLDNARSQARAQLESIKDLVEALENDDETREEAEQAIHEDALSVEVRGGWRIPGSPSEDDEYSILLCTGGPAVRIVGELDEHKQPTSARLECQDWFTPWTPIGLTFAEEDILRRYAGCFYFGE
jgi:hypothetical protein